jgi:glycoside hydrolase-like protein/VCBS repeat protein
MSQRLRFTHRAFVLALVLTGTMTLAGPAASQPTKAVSYRGVRVEVPAGWPVYDLAKDPTRCVRYDAHAVYLGAQSSRAMCPSRLVGRTETVQLEPLEQAPASAALARKHARVAGQEALVDPDGATAGNLLTVFPRPRVAVGVTFGTDRALADRIVSSIRIGSGSAPAAGFNASDVTGAGLAAPAAVESPTVTAAASGQPAPLAPGIAQGEGFEACTAPAYSSMQAWLQSPYRTIGIYIGGISRGCSQANLTASWVADVARLGWSFIPTYVGLQAPCTSYSNRINPSTAFDQGKSAGNDAMSKSDLLGLPTGSPIYFDMEAFTYSNTSCRKAVQDFINGWTRQLQHNGYQAGVYGSAASTIRSVVDVYNNSAYRRPNALWIARWNGVHSVYGEPEVPDSLWNNHQRIHQYRGGHTETHGGVTINIDNDFLDGPIVRFSSIPRWLFADVSGDGKGDLVHLCCKDYLNTWTSHGDGTYAVKSFRARPLYGVQLGNWLAADITGDGKSDLIHLCCGDLMNVWRSVGDGTYLVSTVKPSSGYNFSSGSWRTGDVNGDGRIDLIHLCCSEYMRVWLSNGNGTFSVRSFHPSAGYVIQSGSWQSGDFNGDGKGDLIHLCCSTWARVWLSRGDGTYSIRGVYPSPGYAIQSGSWRSGDVNGDGRDDLLHFCCPSYLNTLIANADGTFQVVRFTPPAGYAMGAGSWLVADLSGDGHDDLVHVCCAGYLNTWTSTTPGAYTIDSFNPRPGYAILSGSWRAIDLSGDGKDDLVHLCCKANLNSWLSAGDGTFAVSSSPI